MDDRSDSIELLRSCWAKPMKVGVEFFDNTNTCCSVEIIDTEQRLFRHFNFVDVINRDAIRQGQTSSRKHNVSSFCRHD